MKSKSYLIFSVLAIGTAGSTLIFVSDNKLHEQVGAVFLSFSLIVSVIGAILENKEAEE